MPGVLSGSELWLLRLMADRGLALLDASGVVVVVEERGELRVAATSGQAEVRVRILPVANSALGDVHTARRPLALENPRGDEAAWLHELGLEARSILVEPLSMSDTSGGLVIALRRGGSFRGADQEALRAFAASVAQRLNAERSVEIERLRHGMDARERERRHWAREIHDETVQGLGALRLMLANARDTDSPQDLRVAVDGVLEGLATEIDGLRHLITELRPAALDDLGLVPALEALVRRVEVMDGLEVEGRLEIDEGAHGRLDPELESTIYRVVQEALTNIGRHANATNAWVTVLDLGEDLLVEVADDGQGVQASRDRPRDESLGPSGFGVSGMHERAELVGAELEIADRPGGGTVVRMTVPLAGRPRETPVPQPGVSQ
jgi:signal transduction histidine kinase